MWKALCESGEGVLIELINIRIIEQLFQSSVYALIQKILDQFQSVFQLTLGLPPRRACDHVITLQPSTPPINVRPY